MFENFPVPYCKFVFKILYHTDGWIVKGIPWHDRTCPRCSSNEVEDELHFLLTCSALHNERESLIQCITDNCINLIKLINKDKFIWLMNNKNKDILVTLCSYIKNHERCG